MTMAETEESIRQDLTALGDDLNRMAYLAECGKEEPGIPAEERREEDLVPDCQARTWLQAERRGDILLVRADSESALVKGALSLLREIYDGRDIAEISSYTCGLLDFPLFRDLFREQENRGLRRIIRTLEGAEVE
ncbi:MAG: SufE family protein [Oscillospiraceae bacterium]|nr:SufE family protein [Oscillospiraceae bacterium]